MTNQCIENTISDVYYQELFPDLSSSGNIWNIFDAEIDEEESSLNGYTGISDKCKLFFMMRIMPLTILVEQ